MLRHVEKCAGALPSLNDLADVAGLSPFHFHRFFKLHTGEGPYSYMQRLALERAARELIYKQTSITNISIDAGYEYPGDFTRAFKKLFGLNPSSYRKSGLLKLNVLNKEHDIVALISKENIHISLKKVKPFYVASLRHIGPYEDSLNSWYMLKKFLIDEGIEVLNDNAYGISHDLPCITPPQKFRMDLCFPINSFAVKAKEACYLRRKYGIFIKEIGIYNRYISILIKGPHSLIYPVYNYILSEWKCDRRIDIINSAGFEIYYNSPRHTSTDGLLTELFIPIK